jgi:hypothetical protein
MGSQLTLDTLCGQGIAEFTVAGLIVLVACVVAVRWYRTRALRSGAVGSIA